MIWAGLFWAFGVGASVPALIQDKTIRGKSMEYLCLLHCYLSLVFVPSTMYLLWQHDRWATMYFYDKENMHGFWPGLLAFSYVALGIMGYVVSTIAKEQGHPPLYIWVTAYDFMFAVLSFGYDRFLYAGSGQDFDAGVPYSLMDFFTKSEVRGSLVVLSIFVVLPLVIATCNLPGIEEKLQWNQKNDLIIVSSGSHVLNTVLISMVFLMLRGLEVLDPVAWARGRLLAFLVGQIVFGAALIGPLFLIKT